MQLAPAVPFRPGIRPLAWLRAELAAERDRFPIWLPVFMGAGVLGYFSVRTEPPLWAGATVLGPAMLAWALGRHVAPLRLLLPPLIAGALGFCASQFATARAPPLDSGLPRHATIVTGTVQAVETLPKGRRITLGSVRLGDAAQPLPRPIRLRLRATDPVRLATGDTMRVRAIVRPPPSPAYPGAWDIQRDDFYVGYGGGGYALGPAQRLRQATPAGIMGLVQRLREVIAARVVAAIPGAAGSIAVTLLTGASRGIPEADHAAFRESGLAHLLAVAGLHIGIVMGFAMACTRLLLALSERASLFWPTKQISALVALGTGAGYMVLTGMHVPIVRSFCMATLFTLALLCGRRPASLRGLAVAAVALLLIEPQELTGASLQMSFSAVLALISGYETLRPWLQRLHGRSWPRRIGCYLLALALTSALAGTASLPFGAYHFGHIQLYYVAANMAAVPITALLVLPAGMLSLPLMPFGMEWLALRPMGWGIQAILAVAHAVASWPAATVDVSHIPAWGLGVLSIGLAWAGIWRTRLRLFGLLALALGLTSPALYRPPDLLISADARLIGMRTQDGVFIQQRSGAAEFTRDAWLRYWGVAAAKPIPNRGEAAEGVISCVADTCLLRVHRNDAAALLVRKASRRRDCLGLSVIVSADPARGLCPRPWPKLVDRFTVWRNGAVAIWLDNSGAEVVTDRAERGKRPWVAPPPQPRRRANSSLPRAKSDGQR